MNKKSIELILTSNTLDKIKASSHSQRGPISNTIKQALDNWYENNKNRLEDNSESNNIVRCCSVVDKETEKIYKLFVEDCMKNLFENLLK